MMRTGRSKTHGPGFLNVITILFGFYLLTGCSTAPSSSEDQSGSVAVSIKLSADSPSAQETFSADDTRVMNANNKVYIRIYEGNGSLLAQGGPWNWSLGQGTVSGVSPGSGRTIMVDVYDNAGSKKLYTGGVAGVTINSGLNNFTGTPIYVTSLYDDTPSECANFSGVWNVEVIDYSYCTNSYSDSSYYIFNISQTGCDVQLTVEGWPNPIPGVVMGDTLFLEETTLFFTELTDHFSGWELEILDGSSFNGLLYWDINYSSGGACNGYSDLFGIRETELLILEPQK